MPAKDHAAWDRFPEVGRMLFFGLRAKDNILDNAFKRTRVMARLERSTEDPHARDTAAQLAYRLQLWHTKPLIVAPIPLFAEWVVVLPSLVLGVALLLMTAGPMIANFRAQHSSQFAVPLLAGSLCLLLGLFGLARRRIFVTPVKRLLRAACPDCAYDLSASKPLPPPFDPSTIGHPLGPHHCPECGALWPLIPPDVATNP